MLLELSLGHEEGPGPGGQLGADAEQEAVGFRQGGRGVLVDTGGGGQEEGHGGAPFAECRI